jgi:LacI family transcriptional regulator
VLINTRGHDRGQAAIHLDNAAGALAVVEHLVGLGRKRLVHIAGPQDNIDAQERASAFRGACAAKQVDCEIVQGDFSEESGASATEALLRSRQPFDALFAANDNMALGALQALRAAGKEVPGEVAVAGFDDIPLAKHVGLTTVRVRIAELGAHAFDRLIAVLGNEDAGGDERHAPELVVRSTTDSSADRAQ